MFICQGISHKTSSIDIREKFFLTSVERELLLSRLKQDAAVEEAFIISTCNRTEIYAKVVCSQEDFFVQYLCDLKKIKLSSDIKSMFYGYSEDKAVRHLFSVVCGLDSLVIGEKQILGQMKQAVALAQEKQMLGKFLNILTNMAIGLGKKVRRETQINCGGDSVSWAAVKRAEIFLAGLSGKSVLIIGAGKMSELAAGDFKRKGVKNLYVMNRTEEKGIELAKKFKAQAVSFWDIKEVLPNVDVCICSASAPHFLIDSELVRQVMGAVRKQILFIDISMPRNIDPAVSKVKGAVLVGLDELDVVLKSNTNQRLTAVYQVEKIISRKVKIFYDKLSCCCDNTEAGLKVRMQAGFTTALSGA